MGHDQRVLPYESVPTLARHDLGICEAEVGEAVMEFFREAPSEVNTSAYEREQAEGWLRVLYLGRSYYIPLTMEMKKICGISRSGDEIGFTVERNRQRLERMLRVIVGSLLGQLSDTIGAQIKTQLTDQVTGAIEELVRPAISGMVQEKMGQALLPEGETTKEETT
jgi:hypothetical protein